MDSLTRTRANPSRALELYNASADAGWKFKDFSSVYKYLEGLSLK